MESRRSRAELENPGRDSEPRVFASVAHGVRMVVPRGWRATDQPSYPGLLLWILRAQPPAQIVLTAEPISRELYCAWPPACRATSEPLAVKAACALRARLQASGIRVDPLQPGPRLGPADQLDPSDGLSSYWLEYDDGKRFSRHAIAASDARLYSLAMATPSADARAAHARAFDQMLRSVRALRPEEAPAAAAGAPASAGDAGAPGAREAPASSSGGSAAPPSPPSPLAPGTLSCAEPIRSR